MMTGAYLGGATNPGGRTGGGAFRGFIGCGGATGEGGSSGGGCARSSETGEASTGGTKDALAKLLGGVSAASIYCDSWTTT